MNRSRFLALSLTTTALIAGASTMTATAVASDQNGDLVGAGSTLVAPLMAQWAQDFEARYSIGVTYGAVGSGAGIAQITARTVDFGASDAPLTADQAAACNGCVQVPWALTATGIAINVPGIRAVHLSGPVLAQIYLGHITNWNDKSIKKLNKGVNLPNLKITPVFRSDGSGDTYAFTNFLSSTVASWKKRIGYSTQVSFPTGVGAKGNDGISSVVGTTAGALGYVSASYIVAHGLNAAALLNAAGRYEYPNLSNIEAAAKSVKKVPASNELHIVNPPKKYKSAYPLSTFTYAIVPKASPKKDLVAKFILYAAQAGQKFGAALDFAPIPQVVLNAAFATTRQLAQG